VVGAAGWNAGPCPRGWPHYDRPRIGLTVTGPGFLVLVVALAAATGLGIWVRGSGRRLGHAKPATDDVLRLGPAELGADLGARATLVQFSSAFCQPCRATRRILTDVSRDVAGVAHVELDAESHLELVRQLDIRRTPTVLVLDADGRVVRRASGQPRRVDVIAALGEAVS
jgi:thiol-disulfide isomerase/thioredoxin